MRTATRCLLSCGFALALGACGSSETSSGTQSSGGSAGSGGASGGTGAGSSTGGSATAGTSSGGSSIGGGGSGAASSGATGGTATGGTATGGAATGGAATGGTATGGTATGGAGGASTGGTATGGTSAGGSGASGGSGGSGGTGGVGGTGGSGGGTSTEIDFDPDAVPGDAADFPHGVQTGDAATSGTIFWTRYQGSSELLLRVYIQTTPGKVALYHEGTVTPDSNGFVHEDVGGLPSLTELSYVFLEQDGPNSFSGRSRIGRVVTPPAGDAQPILRFGAVSCTANGTSFPVLDLAADEDLDFFVLVGDTVYADSASTEAQYRSIWEPQISSPSYQAIFGSTAHYATWDDHEVDNNWNPETISAARLTAAYQTFFDYLAIRRHPTEPRRLWRSYRWGNTAEIFVLDSRGERRPSTRTGPNAEYISAEQLQWLKDGLQASPATFKLVINSVPISRTWFGLNTDAWTGYAAQRDDLINWLDSSGVTGVFFVAGDHHFASAGTLQQNGPGSDIFEVLVGPGDQNGFAGGPPPNSRFASSAKNVTILELDPNVTPPTIRGRWIGTSGNIIADELFEL